MRRFTCPKCSSTYEPESLVSKKYCCECGVWMTLADAPEPDRPELVYEDRQTQYEQLVQYRTWIAPTTRTVH